MDNDDLPVGRILSRREALALLGTAGTAALIAACAPSATPTALPTAVSTVASAATPFNTQAPTAVAVSASPTALAATQAPAATAVAASATALPSCIVRPSLTEGPYFVDEQLNRSDIRSEPSDNSVREGIPLVLTYNVLQIANSTCTPLQGAQVDVWHCDADGQYSDTGSQTEGAKWLRGYQLTDANGVAQFTTIYPGWYPGRTTHIHFKIRTNAPDSNAYEFTSQLFFDEALTSQVYSLPPYADRGQKNMANSRDGIYSDQLLLAVNGDANGYNAVFHIALDLTDAQAGADDSAGGGGGGPGGPPLPGGQP